MPSKSKNKGNRGETELSGILSGIFAGHFARVPNSGAMIGGQNKIRKLVLSQTQNRIYRGDLIPPDFMPRFVVEAKSYDAFRFHQLLTTGRCPLLDEWIDQTLDCIDPGDAWFIAYKITRIGWFVAVPDGEHGYAFGNHCVYQAPHVKVQVTELLDFFTKNRDLILQNSA